MAKTESNEGAGAASQERVTTTETESEVVSGLALPLLEGFAKVGGITLATIILHACGYITLSFRLRALGLEPDLTVLDERFLFTGAHFLVHLAIAISSIVGIVVVVLALAWLMPRQVVDRVRSLSTRLAAWATPERRVWLAIAWAMLVLQLVLSHAFALDDLLLEGLPCDPSWLRNALINESQGPMSSLFVGLVALALPPTAVFVHSLRRVQRRGEQRSATLILLGFLSLVLLLILPAQYGILSAGNAVPRLATIPASLGGSALDQTANDQAAVEQAANTQEASTQESSAQTANAQTANDQAATEQAATQADTTQTASSSREAVSGDAPAADAPAADELAGRIWQIWRGDPNIFLLERPSNRRLILVRPKKVGQEVDIARHDNLWRVLAHEVECPPP